jgi:signal transduction histidine kinase
MTTLAKRSYPSKVLSGSLVVRLAATMSVLIVTTCIVLSVVLVRRHLEEIRKGLVDRGGEISGFVAREAELGALSGDVTALRQLGMVALGQPDVVYARFFDRTGALLASVGQQPSSGDAVLASGWSPDGTPILVNSDVWEFQAPIMTTALRHHREELLEEGIGRNVHDQASGARERIGTVSIGIVLSRLHADRRIAFITAMVFTIVVAVLAVAGALVLTHGTLRALASAAELAEERSRLAELKANFVTQASHEFRTPLAVILACCTALKRYAARMTPEEQRRRLTKIHASVRHMTELIEDVLTLGRGESGKLACVPQASDLEALCQEVVADVEAASAAAQGIALRCTSSGRDAMIDPKLVRQILRNLLSNALKYSPDGTTVWLDVTRGDGVIVFRVTDHGIGIPPEDQKAIFEPFHRAANVGKIPGSGLGLAIAQEAIGLHGGAISVDSALGRGTTFTVTLRDNPLAGESPRAAGVSP